MYVCLYLDLYAVVCFISMTEDETKTPGEEEKQDEEEQNLNTTNIKQNVYIYTYYIRLIVRLCIACPFCTWMLSAASDSPWGSA